MTTSTSKFASVIMLEEAKRRVWSMFLVWDKQNYWDKKLSNKRL